MIPQFDIIRIYALRATFLRACMQIRLTFKESLSWEEIHTRRKQYAKELGQ
jgi:hypothetical protein